VPDRFVGALLQLNNAEGKVFVCANAQTLVSSRKKQKVHFISGKLVVLKIQRTTAPGVFACSFLLPNVKIAPA